MQSKLSQFVNVTENETKMNVLARVYENNTITSMYAKQAFMSLKYVFNVF